MPRCIRPSLPFVLHLCLFGKAEILSSRPCKVFNWSENYLGGTMVANKRGQGRGLRGRCFHPSWPVPHIKHPGKFVASDNLLQLEPSQLLGQPRDTTSWPSPCLKCFPGSLFHLCNCISIHSFFLSWKRGQWFLSQNPLLLQNRLCYWPWPRKSMVKHKHAEDPCPMFSTARFHPSTGTLKNGKGHSTQASSREALWSSPESTCGMTLALGCGCSWPRVSPTAHLGHNTWTAGIQDGSVYQWFLTCWGCWVCFHSFIWKSSVKPR